VTARRRLSARTCQKGGKGEKKSLSNNKKKRSRDIGTDISRGGKRELFKHQAYHGGKTDFKNKKGSRMSRFLNLSSGTGDGSETMPGSDRNAG